MMESVSKSELKTHTRLNIASLNLAKVVLKSKLTYDPQKSKNNCELDKINIELQETQSAHLFTDCEEKVFGKNVGCQNSSQVKLEG
mmetsp:Transcript_34824/g.40311  ORF Transcript_34824/g.40311 Transcript_34824/m.40311 type:complete len:86 (+) Transcript_34824:531-788(+)